MNTLKHYAWLILLLLPIVAFSQNENRFRHSFSVHAGYANMLNGTGGLTSTNDDYIDKMCSGLSWDAQYFFRVKSNPEKVSVGFGLLYSGYSSKEELEYSSDHIYTHYLSPQFGVYIPLHKNIDLRGNIGIGPILYMNNGTVFGKPREINESSIACNLGLDAIWYLNSHWGLSVDIQYVNALLEKIHPLYHGETIGVRPETPISLSRLNCSIGITYLF